MASKPQPNTSALFIDPNNEPVRVINQVTFHPMKDSLFDLTLCTVRAIADGKDSVRNEAVVVARLRFDLGMAKALCDGLGKQVQLIEASTQRAN